MMPEEKISALAQAFSTLRTAPGVSPWNPTALDAWASSPAPGSGARWAARFVLNLWDDKTEWASGRFEVFDALSAWDEAHKEVFLDWAKNPWWP